MSTVMNNVVETWELERYFNSRMNFAAFSCGVSGTASSTQMGPAMASIRTLPPSVISNLLEKPCVHRRHLSVDLVSITLHDLMNPASPGFCICICPFHQRLPAVVFIDVEILDMVCLKCF